MALSDYARGYSWAPIACMTPLRFTTKMASGRQPDFRSPHFEHLRRRPISARVVSMSLPLRSANTSALTITSWHQWSQRSQRHVDHFLRNAIKVQAHYGQEGQRPTKFGFAAVRGHLNRMRATAAARSIPTEELRGATITLSNFGMIGRRFASLVVVPPQVAIFGTGRIAPCHGSRRQDRGEVRAAAVAHLRPPSCIGLVKLNLDMERSPGCAYLVVTSGTTWVRPRAS